jgi:hypothetical protein
MQFTLRSVSPFKISLQSPNKILQVTLYHILFFLRQPADGPLFNYVGPLNKLTITSQCLATFIYTIPPCSL